MAFDEWVYEVCLNISSRTRKEITDVYSSIDLTNAKLSFPDGIRPEEYNQ
jgi:hypothetical protein